MSRVVAVMNKMLLHPENVSDVHKSDEEYYFKYKDYVWSILYNDDIEDGGYVVFFYPDFKNAGEAAGNSDWGRHKFVRYAACDFPGKENQQTFSALYKLMQEKIFGIDKVFDAILEDEGVPF